MAQPRYTIAVARLVNMDNQVQLARLARLVVMVPPVLLHSVWTLVWATGEAVVIRLPAASC
jgi:hypothetical protein